MKDFLKKFAKLSTKITIGIAIIVIFIAALLAAFTVFRLAMEYVSIDGPTFILALFAISGGYLMGSVVVREFVVGYQKKVIKNNKPLSSIHQKIYRTLMSLESSDKPGDYPDRQRIRVDEILNRNQS